MPSVWWEAHVAADTTLNVAGVTIPGIPFVVIGHNARIGWGLTNVGADVQDFFVEQLDRIATALSGRGGVGAARGRSVTRFASADASEPLAFEVRSTRHGPVLNPDDWHEVVCRAMRRRPTQLERHRARAEMGRRARRRVGSRVRRAGARRRAGTAFVDAVRQFSAPSQNFVYADVDGNIGYAMSGLVPVRSGSDGVAAGVRRCRATPIGTDGSIRAGFPRC